MKTVSSTVRSPGREVARLPLVEWLVVGIVLGLTMWSCSSPGAGGGGSGGTGGEADGGQDTGEDQDQVGDDACTLVEGAGQVDTDGDGRPDDCDNCPDTPNEDLADTNGDGVGDACDDLAGNQIAAAGAGGVVEATVDERLRPTRIVAPDLLLELNWSDDASGVEVSAEGGGESSEFHLDVDLSDEAILEAIDFVEQQSGDDLGALRDFIDENPGLVSSVASGEQAAPAADTGDTTGKLSTDNLQEWDRVSAYLVRYGLAISKLTRFVAEFDRQGNVPAELRASIITHLVQLSALLTLDYARQLQACAACTAECRAPCPTPDGTPSGGTDTVACCYASSADIYRAAVSCDDVDSAEDCTSRLRGLPHEDVECGDVFNCDYGACCVVGGGAGYCTLLTRADCDTVRTQPNLSGKFFDGFGCCDSVTLEQCPYSDCD